MKKLIVYVMAVMVTGIFSAHAYGQKDIPPPPPPPKPPKFVTGDSKEAETSIKNFYKRNPSVATIEISDDKAVIKLKNGNKETYDLSNNDDEKNFIDKYGQPPLVPEPPSPPSPPPPPPKPVKVKS